jgi:hypothetical protein
VRLDPVSAAARWLAWRAAAALLVVAALFAVAALAPMRVYKPRCGRSHPVFGRLAIDGPLRPEYVEMFTRLMRQEGFRHRRTGDTILVPLLPIFDGSKLFDCADFTLNMEWRVEYSIVNGYTAHGCSPPPEAVRRLHGRIEQNCEWPIERTQDGRSIPPPTFWISDDCALFRAAVIRIEDMVQPLPVLEGFSSHRDQRMGPPSTGAARQRP